MISKKLILSIVIICATFVFSSCANYEDDSILQGFLGELQNVQSHDELIELIIAHEGEPSQKELADFIETLNIPGRPLEQYLEDLDFLAVYFESATGFSIEGYLGMMQSVIANFYHVNDMIFHTFTIMLLGHIYNEHGLMPFYAFPNSDLFPMDASHLSENEKTPNGILILVNAY